MRKLTIGVASYRNPDKLRRALASVERMSRTDWECVIVHNHTEDEAGYGALDLAKGAAKQIPRFRAIEQPNSGYAGAINTVLNVASSEYIAYLDNDAEILTPGWDETLCGYLDRFHEIGIVFPNGGAYPIRRGAYVEVMWATGFCWVLNRLCMADVGKFDADLGHQEEADYCQRVRMAGWKCAAVEQINVRHHATATNDPAQIERINRGVRAWVDKWNLAFNGKNFNYHSPNVTRFEDWPPNALYLEEYWKLKLPDLNKSPEVVTLDGRQYDLIRVPRLKDFYRGRII